MLEIELERKRRENDKLAQELKIGEENAKQYSNLLRDTAMNYTEQLNDVMENRTNQRVTDDILEERINNLQNTDADVVFM